MRSASVWARLLGVEKTIVDGVEFDPDEEVLVASVRPKARERDRCGICRRRCGRYDNGDGPRRWRALDLGAVRAYLEAAAPRVSCPRHGVVVAAVPWARHGAGHTHGFDATVAWLAVACSKTTVTQLLRTGWRTVGAIVTRVCADIDAVTDRFANLRRIGIDEISYKRGHKYLIVVVDHDTGLLIWAAPGKDAESLGRFFEALGEARCAKITHVSADGAEWIAKAVSARCVNAVLCADPFHVVGWATAALDEVRRIAWNDARRATGGSRAASAGYGRRIRLTTGDAKTIKRSRWPLLKNPEDLSQNQAATLAWIAKTDPRLHRAYLLKEGLRHVFRLTGNAAKNALDAWIAWARRSRIPEFVDLQRKIIRHRTAIEATLDHQLSNGLIESTNTKIRVITRVAYGFKDPHALIALAMLSLGGYRPDLPGRK